MATDAGTAPRGTVPDLSAQWRSLTRAATFVAVLTSPAVFVWFHNQLGWPFRYALVVTVLEVAAFRGLIDLLFRRYIETPSLFGNENVELREADVVGRRRVAFWRGFWRLVRFAVVFGIVLVFFGKGLTWGETASGIWHGLGHLTTPAFLSSFVTLPFLFFFNFLIF